MKLAVLFELRSTANQTTQVKETLVMVTASAQAEAWNSLRKVAGCGMGVGFIAQRRRLIATRSA